MKAVALLPMKQNSERDLGGKPLFRWILDTLQQVDAISRVVINTDARAILAEKGLTDSERVLIRDRKPELCGDTVSMNLVLADDVENVEADVYLMTHTTNPFLSPKTIVTALERYRTAVGAGNADSLFTVNKIQTRFYRGDGSPVNHDPNNLVRTQDLEPWYEENSNLYIFSRASFEATRARIGKKPMLFEISKSEAVDIDNQEDWNIAAALVGLAGAR
jgi:CMP-N-acetylneuraminic acid synthetase